MSAQFARAPHQGQTSVQPSPAPHAALLIDFDNVTMGIRSDLTKELKNLLNSAIIKGKVAVQRAYADWRRYPQYIVPLAESSVDLIFAPAYGSAKKNATDIRLAIDALELVFIRPEIGTFILLSGDSDFSSLVLKLKEYGKYVIGVGIRESASDLLVQNCDEYYSYSALTGLTRAGDEAPVASEDPWELVDVAIRQMADNDDVMRSDRLKQVLLELDPNFDEKALGFTKFNKFLQEAASRGVLALRKQENGQFEIAPGDGVPASREDEGEPRSRRRRGGRGRRRDGTDGREERPARTEEPAAAAPAMQAEAAAPAEVEERSVPTARRDARTERVPAPEAAEPDAAKRAVEPTRAEPTRAEPTRTEPTRTEPTRAEPVVEPVGNDLDAAYVLLRRATGDLARGAAQPARDSDVKRRLLELDPQWDESNLGFSKFSRFLRRAHDDEVVTLRKLENGNYEVFAGSVEPIEDDGRSRRGRGRDERGRRGGRGREQEDGVTSAADDAQPAHAAAARPETEPGTPARASKETPAPAAKETPAPAAKAERTQDAVPEAAAAARAPRPLGVRRGSRSRGGAPTAPPPLFEGQAAKIGSAQPTAQRSTEPPAAVAEPGRPTALAGAAEPATWFPSDRDGAIEHLAGYKGVGRKSAEAVVDEFGAGALARALTDQRDRVLKLLGRRRGETLLEAFDAELAERSSGPRAAGERRPGPRKATARTAKKRSGAAAAKSSKPEKSQEDAGASAVKKSSRTRRGGARKKPARSS